MPFFGSRHRRLPSLDKENAGQEDTYTTITCHFSQHHDCRVGLSLGENNTIVRLEATSPLAKQFRVGDMIVSVNGRDCANMSVTAMIEGEDHVILTAIRNSRSVSPTDRGWAGH